MRLPAFITSLTSVTLFFTTSISSASTTIIDVPLDLVSTVRQEYDGEIDILGTDQVAKTAQIKLNREYLNKNNFQTLNPSDFTKVSIENYLNPEKLNAALEVLANTYPELATLFEVGESTDGRKIRGLILTAKTQKSQNSDQADKFDEADAPIAKPTVLFNGMHHAREVMATEVPYDIAQYLLQNYQSDPEIRQWFDDYQIIIIPQVNPDGNDKVHKGNRWWRKNTYKKDNNVYGVDLNRNYPYLWNTCNGSSGSPGSEIYRGTEPASEPESRAMIALSDKYKPVVDISYHSYSELILYPFGCRDEINDAKVLFDSIAQTMNNNIINDEGKTGQYQYGNTADTIYQADGGDIDYHWKNNNVISYVIELNSRQQGFQPSYTIWRDKTVKNQRGGWMSLLRRISTGAVKVQLDPALTDVTYRIKQNNKEDVDVINSDTEENIHTFNFGMNITERGTRPNNLIYQLLPNGDYIIEVLKDKKVILSEDFSIKNDLVELHL